jgi:hypothetical protein
LKKGQRATKIWQEKTHLKNGLKGHSCLLLENGIPHSILKWRGGSLVLMPRKDAENNLKRKTIRKWKEIFLFVSKGGSHWSINRLAIDDDWADKLKMNFVLYIQVLFAQNGIANWRESNCQHKNYLRTFISRVLKVNLVLVSFPPFGRRVLPKLFLLPFEKHFPSSRLPCRRDSIENLSFLFAIVKSLLARFQLRK